MRPDPSGLKSDVMISTKFPVRADLLAVNRRFLTTRYLRPICLRELTLLAKRARWELCDES